MLQWPTVRLAARGAQQMQLSCSPKWPGKKAEQLNCATAQLGSSLKQLSPNTQAQTHTHT